MTAATVRRRDIIRQRRTWLSLPAGYLIIALVLALTIAPMLYMIVGGFSSTAQLNADPNALPHPWVWSNYASIATSSSGPRLSAKIRRPSSLNAICPA